MMDPAAKMLARQAALLNQVLIEECSYVDRNALGYYCGLGGAWWSSERALEPDDFLRLLLQLKENEVPNIALRIAARVRLQAMGVAGYAVLSSPSLESGINLCATLAQKQFPDLRPSHFLTRDHFVLQCSVKGAGARYAQVLLEYWIVSLWKCIQDILPEGLAACASYGEFNFASPSYHGQFQQLLGCRVRFDQPSTVLAIPRQWLSLRGSSSNRAQQALYEQQIRRLLPGINVQEGTAVRVKRLLLERPGHCAFRLETVAEVLSLSSRTLRRRLTDEGTCFRTLVTEVRMTLAEDYLLNSRISAQQISYHLGYTQANNFYRAFKKHFGRTPEEYRNGVTVDV